jgi:hypothetical protein
MPLPGTFGWGVGEATQAQSDERRGRGRYASFAKLASQPV